MNNLELRILAEGYIEIKGKIPYMSKSSSLFSKEKRAFFNEQIQLGAFTTCLNNQSEIPKLLINHDWKKFAGDIVSFDYEEEEGKFKFTYIIKPSEELLTNLDKVTNFSFGMIVDQDEWQQVDNSNYIRTIKNFTTIKEFSLLIGLEPAYNKAKIYIDGEEEAKEEELTTFVAEAKKFIADKKNNDALADTKEFIKAQRKKQCAIDDKRIQEAKELIAKQRRKQAMLNFSGYKTL